MKVIKGISPFEGVAGTTWYGWAMVEGQQETPVEGNTHFIKLFARLDAWKLARKLRRGERS